MGGEGEVSGRGGGSEGPKGFVSQKMLENCFRF